MTARKTPRHFTQPATTERAVAMTRAHVEAVADYSAMNVPLDIVQAAGLRNGQSPESIHEAIKAVMVARSLHK